MTRSRSGVGESPVWSVEEAALYWVDITGHAVRRLHPATGTEDVWSMPEMVTSLGLRRSGGFVLGLRKRICLWTPDGDLDDLAVIEPDRPGNRLNEGAVAPDGSFWVGTMQDNILPDGGARDVDEATGALWRVAPDGSVARLCGDLFGITNMMIWRDGSFVTADTVAGAFYAYAWDGSALRDREPFGSAAPGAPDGGAADADGTIWNARFGGGCLIGFGPAGDVVTRLDVPCTNPTSAAFGGSDLRDLYVTSATFGLADAAMADNPAEGRVHVVRMERPGHPPNLFEG
ncbi:SMP-30/gluconolactonase/LRE family protein [Jannaschia sp. LMIT008]|uniref:SMP-30/gluconolactonase/LRE family protein n=1 Tax=Jannaschia maritima TaxID=3032585 RepID=UPI0028114EE9|nr:SMP-30/gluconolactonase/LRE family protein [Jannaschia sp. LMIT008]